MVAVEADLQSPVRLVISFATSQRSIGVDDKWAEGVTEWEGEVLYPTPTPTFLYRSSLPRPHQ